MKKNDRYREARKEIGNVLKKKGSVTFEDFLAQYGDYPINPHLHTTKQLNKMTKKGLIRLVVKLEKFIVKVAYQIYKSKLPRLRKAGARYSLRPDTQEYGLMVAQFGEEGYSQMSVKERQKEARRLFTKPRARVRAFKRKTKRKFSRKQLAAQRLFAKRARAGTLRRR